MQGKRTLIKNATVISLDPQVGDRVDCDLLLEGTKIQQIQENLQADDAEIFDASAMIVLPGFVDTHRHTWQTLLRNVAVDWSLGQYFTGIRHIMGDLYTADDMYVANYLGALEALNGGITTLYDWSHNSNSPEHTTAAVSALRDAGIRGVFGYGASNAQNIPISAIPTDFEDVTRIQKRFFSEDGLLQMGLAARGPQFSTMDVVERDFRTAAELGLQVTVHVGSGHWGQSRPVEQLKKRGLLFEGTIYVHCCTIADDEIAMIADSGGHISMSPEVELNMGQGWPATLRALSAGLRPSLSIDVTTSIGGDMFGSMRTTLASARALVNAQALEQQRVLEHPPITSRDVLEFATLSGARGCRIDDRVGSLTVGKEADLVFINTNSIGMFPVNYPIGAVVESAHAGNVEAVMVAGRFVKRDGRMLGIDSRALRNRVEIACDQLFARAGISRNESWMPAVFTGGTRAVAASAVR